jgi:putative copper resistance protein D
MDDVLGDLQVEVRAASQERMAMNPWGNPVPGLPPLVMAGSVLMFIGAIPLVWRPSRGSRSKDPISLAADLALLSGGIMLAGGLIGMVIEARMSPGPVPATADSIAAGAALYAEKCVICHGEEGLGNGPLGLTLRPPPAVLHAHVPLHPDEELYGFIANGFPNTAMPAFSRELSSEEIWHLVNFLRDRFGELAATPQAGP